MTFNVAELPILLYMDDFYLTWTFYYMIFILAEFSNSNLSELSLVNNSQLNSPTGFSI